VSESTNTTARTPEENRTWYNHRIREKRSKGHSFQMITEYAAQSPVPVDQLNDLTLKEVNEVERLRHKKELQALARKIGEDGKATPEAIDFEAVKDLPVTDEAHRTQLARMNLMMRLVDGGVYCGGECAEANERAVAYHEADPDTPFLEFVWRAVGEISAEKEERARRFKERVEALAKWRAENTSMDADYETAIAILNKYGVSKVTADFRRTTSATGMTLPMICTM
jgi:hypothetical protein